MRLDEGNELLGSSPSQKISVIDNCLNNPKPGVALNIALSLAAGNAADAVEIMCVGFIMSEMSDISSYKKALLSSAVFMGMLLGGLGCGYLSDIIGRRPCLLYSLGINTLAGLASAGAPNIEVLIACRMIAGLGIGGSVPIVFSTGAEIFPAHCRGQFLSIIASFWMVGAIYVAFSAWIMLGDDFYGQKIMHGVGWRSFAIVSALPAIVAWFLTYFNIPESPRFLADKQQFSESAAILNALSTVQIEAADLEFECTLPDSKLQSLMSEESHSPPTPPVASAGSILRGGYEPVQAEQPPINSSGLSVDSHQSSLHGTVSALEQSTIGLLFQGALRRTSLTLLVIWFTLSFGTYGMSTWISTLFSDVGIGNPYAAAFIFAVANLPGNIVSLLYIETFGRRWLLSVGMCLAAGSALGFAFDTKLPVVVVLCASLFNAFSVIGWNSLDCLSGIKCYCITTCVI